MYNPIGTSLSSNSTANCREDLNRRLSLINAMIGGAAAYLSPWDGEQLTVGWYVMEHFSIT